MVGAPPDVDEDLAAAAVVDDVITAVVVVVVLEAAAVEDDVTGSTHVDADVAAVALLYFPAGHSWHAADPFTSLKLPASHASHSAPSGPLYPLLQVQLVSSPLPTLEYMSEGQP